MTSPLLMTLPETTAFLRLKSPRSLASGFPCRELIEPATLKIGGRVVVHRDRLEALLLEKLAAHAQG